jgi:hypothetical protein
MSDLGEIRNPVIDTDGRVLNCVGIP